MNRSTPLFSGRRRVTRGLAAALATAATVAGMAVTPAQSAMDADCPDTFPVDGLVAGQPVTGSTVIDGAGPGAFTGQVLGVLDDGIMPGLDMILVRLGSDALDATDVDKRIFDVGIWSGMSGSPVYAADGTLIGAVAYGLSWGASTVAGVTPAAEMRELIEPGGDPLVAPADTIEVPERIQARVVRSGAATERQVESGLSELDVFGVLGLSQRRYNKITRKLDLPDVQRMVGGAGGAALDSDSIVAGGNLATAISYGDIAYTGVGTATMVCGSEVVGFGHPMMWNGPTGLSLHPAEAIFIQEESLGAGFKVANIGDPVGTIDQDRMAGIAGFIGDSPEVTTITSRATSETGERTGHSYVNLSDWVPDVALSHLLTTEDRVFDGIGEGSATVSYEIVGEREDGTAFSLNRSDVYADEYDLTWATAWDLYMTLARLQGSRVEELEITDVTTDSDLSRDVVVASIEEVAVKQGGKWVPVGRRLTLPAGQTATFRVGLLANGVDSSTVQVELPIRRRDAGRSGWIEIVGGNSTSSWFGGRNLPVDELLDRIQNAPHNDDVVAAMRLWRDRRGQKNVTREDRASAGVPVNGAVGMRLRIVG